MINNMISISLDGEPCVSDAYSTLFIYNSINLILVRVERKSLIRKTLILIRVPFVAVTFSPSAFLLTVSPAKNAGGVREAAATTHGCTQPPSHAWPGATL